MRHLKSGRKLSRRKDHRKALLANLAVSLINYGKIRTTDAKAKEVRPFIERMVTFARRGDLHARRIVLSRLKNALAVKKLFEEIGPRYVNRFGGYTRIVKLGFRHGDNSPISLIEFVTEEESKKTPQKKKRTVSKAEKKPAITPDETVEAAEAAPEKVEDIPETDTDTGMDQETEVLKEKADAAVEAAPETDETTSVETESRETEEEPVVEETTEEEPAQEQPETAEEPPAEKEDSEEEKND